MYDIDVALSYDITEIWVSNQNKGFVKTVGKALSEKRLFPGQYRAFESYVTAKRSIWDP